MTIAWQSLIAEFGCYHYSMVVVPIYDTFKGSVAVEILHQSKWFNANHLAQSTNL